MVDRSLAGAVALVTGGGRGIGRAIAERLSASGASVAVAARTFDEIDEVAASIDSNGGRALGLCMDVTDRDAVAKAVEEAERRLGDITILINNAGTLGAIGPAWEWDPDKWWTDIETHLRGTYLCSQAVLPGMVARGSGRIVNVVGMLGQGGEANVSSYACAKAAVFRFTECLANEVATHGIKVFCMSPGPVRTQMTDYLVQSEEAKRWLPWFKDEADGEWVPAEMGAELIVRLARGDADRLSGGFVHVFDDLDALMGAAAGGSDGRRLMRVVP